MSFFILTNNPYVEKQFVSKYATEYLEVPLAQILEAGRAYIHKGHKLLSHPLSGSVKPYETPYKSVMLSKTRGSLDLESLHIIEESLENVRKFKGMKREYSESVYRDFQMIDFTLIDGAVSSAQNMLL